MSGPYVCGSRVLQDPNEQLTGEMRNNILSAAVIYTTVKNAQPTSHQQLLLSPKRQLSGTDYILYKKGQLLAASKPNQRPPQTVIITDLQAFNAANCP